MVYGETKTVAYCKGNGFSVVNRVLCNGWKERRKPSGELLREPCEKEEHKHKVLGTTSKGIAILNEITETVKVPVKCGRRIENPINPKCANCGGDLEYFDLQPIRRKE